jgi:hypothetical protein
MEIAAQSHETTRRHHRAESEFLNPKSMLTPGAAGAVIMLISNSFGIPGSIRRRTHRRRAPARRRRLTIHAATVG